ncbi:MAG: UbiA family prenyltransferase [Pseudomonadota bacterium]
MHPFYIERVQPLLQQGLRQLHRAITWLRPYVHVCHLHRPVDLILLLLPLLWTVSLSPGAIHYPDVVVLLLAATAMRCAAWVYNDLLDATMLPEAPESFVTLKLVSRQGGWRLFAGLLAFTILLLLLLDTVIFLWGSVALGLLLGYPLIKRRTLLTQAYMGLCFAWMVAMAQVIAPDISAKALWLLFTATLLWATANTILYAIPRRGYEERVGIGSLVYLFGDNSGVFVLILQVFAVISLWFVAKQAALGFSFSIALLAALTLLPYQQWLLARHPGSGATRAYRSNILFGLMILFGLIGERL